MNTATIYEKYSANELSTLLEEKQDALEYKKIDMGVLERKISDLERELFIIQKVMNRKSKEDEERIV